MLLTVVFIIYILVGILIPLPAGISILSKHPKAARLFLYSANMYVIALVIGIICMLVAMFNEMQGPGGGIAILGILWIVPVHVISLLYFALASLLERQCERNLPSVSTWQLRKLRGIAAISLVLPLIGFLLGMLILTFKQ